jgi:hypothetical protein
MPYNFFKEIKLRCNLCKDVITPNSNTEWVECSCGSIQVIGKNSFLKIKGTEYTNLSTYDMSNLPDFIEPS